MNILMTCLKADDILSVSDVLLRFLYMIFNLKPQFLDTIWRQAIP